MTPLSVERARLCVDCGPLADTLAPRFVRALAAHTTLSVDRVDELVLVVEAITAHCGDLLDDAQLELAALVTEDRFELVAGPFEPGTPHRLLAADQQPGVIGHLATSTDVRSGRDGRERLHVVLT